MESQQQSLDSFLPSLVKTQLLHSHIKPTKYWIYFEHHSGKRILGNVVIELQILRHEVSNSVILNCRDITMGDVKLTFAHTSQVNKVSYLAFII